ncbi:hypothetical protein [Terrilactibacillus laevilacticus]|nr:hypothetical protein [Terrilactibacillus laevilacticus]
MDCRLRTSRPVTTPTLVPVKGSRLRTSHPVTTPTFAHPVHHRRV